MLILLRALSRFIIDDTGIHLAVNEVDAAHRGVLLLLAQADTAVEAGGFVRFPLLALD